MTARYRKDKWNHSHYGRLIFGKELGCHASVSYTPDGKIDYKKTKIVMHETDKVDDGYKTICQFIKDQGYKAEIVDGDDGRPAINVSGGITGPGCTIGILDGTLGIFYISQRIEKPTKEFELPQVEMTISTRKISLHVPDSLDTLAESLKEIFAKLKHTRMIHLKAP